MLNIQKFFVFFAVFQCMQPCLANEQLWGVRFFTGDILDAGTKQQVHLQLKGTGGYSEEKIVQNLGKNPERQRNMVDYYYLRFKDVGPLQAIFLTMGLEKDKWFLSRVEMEKLDNHTSVRIDGLHTTGLKSDRVRTFYVFKTSYWFNRPLETKKFDRPAITTDRTFVLRVITSGMENSGTTSTAYIQFYYSQQGVQSDVFEIRHPSGSGRTVLNRGTTDTFQFTTKYIGIPTGVKMWFKGNVDVAYPDNHYRLDRIELEDIESDGKRMVYSFSRFGWMKVDIGETYYINRTKTHLARTYGLTVFTAQDRNAQTDARVWIQLLGDHGRASEYIQLDNPDRNDFEAASRDFFKFTIDDVGMLHAVRLQIEPGDSWRMSSMYIEWPLQTGWIEAYYVSCFCWVNSHPTVFIGARYLLKEKPHESSNSHK